MDHAPWCQQSSLLHQPVLHSVTASGPDELSGRAPAPCSTHLPSLPVACWQCADLEHGSCDKYDTSFPNSFNSSLAPVFLSNWNERVTRYQLPSGPISAASRMLGSPLKPGWQREKPGQAAEQSVCSAQHMSSVANSVTTDMVHTSFIHNTVSTLSPSRPFLMLWDAERERVSDATMPYYSTEDIWNILIVKCQVSPAFLQCCFKGFFFYIYHLSFCSISCPPCWSLIPAGLCSLPSTFLGSVVRRRRRFDIYWSVRVAESLLGENRTVIWLWKIAFLHFQLSMSCNVKAHYSWPTCSIWRIIAQTVYLNPVGHDFHLLHTDTSLSVSDV